MKVSELRLISEGWWRFNLNVGGFCIRNCQWHSPTRRVFFPIRYDRHRRRHRVVHAYGNQVRRLRELLESGETETPRDRRPCTLTIHVFGVSLGEPLRWVVFGFTVRGFTIIGCRWQPETRSIQLPVTFQFDEQQLTYVRNAVVCAYGAHVNRLREALLANRDHQEAQDSAVEHALAGS